MQLSVYTSSFIWQLQVKSTTKYYSLRFDREKKREIKYKDKSRGTQKEKEKIYIKEKDC